MVPFNVVQTREVDGRPRFHRATSGKVLIGTGIAGLRSLLDVPGLAVGEQADIKAVQWGKLLFNLNNALNALSGLPLATQLADRRWRRLLAAQIEEALAVLRASGIRPARIESVPPGLIPFILRLPDAVFRVAARRMLAIDPQARSSMWEDLERRRSTEIDHLQGAIVTLAARGGCVGADECAHRRPRAPGGNCGQRLAAPHTRGGSRRRGVNGRVDNKKREGGKDGRRRDRHRGRARWPGRHR